MTAAESIRVKDAMILSLAERLAICSALLSRWAERPEFRTKQPLFVPEWDGDYEDA